MTNISAQLSDINTRLLLAEPESDEIRQILGELEAFCKAVTGKGMAELQQAVSKLKGGDLNGAGTMIHQATLQISEAEALPILQLPPDTDEELVREFVTEALEYLTRAEAAMLELEGDPENMAAVDTVFRAFHTIKGVSAFLGLQAIADLAHKAENLLSRVRNREIRFVDGYANLSLQSTDALKDLVERLPQLLGGHTVTVPASLPPLIRALANPEKELGIQTKSSRPEVASNPVASLHAIENAPSRAEIIPPEPRVASAELVEQNIEKIEEILAFESRSEPARSEPSRPEPVAVRVEAPRVESPVSKVPPAEARAETKTVEMESSVRVRTDRLDRLLDIVGELVIAQAMVSQDNTLVRSQQHDLLKKVGHAGKIIRELQDLTMSLRMVPLKATFQKMVRVVRYRTQEQQAGGAGDRGRGYRAGSHHGGCAGGSADPHGAECGGSWD